MNKHISVATLGLMTSAAVVTSLRGLPMMAKEELEMFAYILYAVVLFLIPAGLVAAEFGGAFGNREGGLYVWVGEAFGKKTGFIAIFLCWIQNVFFYPAGLTFVAAAVAFMIGKQHLANDGFYVGIFIMVAFWLCTIVAAISTKFAAKVTSYGFILGTVVPGIILLLLFFWWILSHHDIGWMHATAPAVSEIKDGHAHPRLFPHVSGLSGLAFLGGILLSFAGIESQSVHANQLEDPKKGYPVVIMIAAIISFLIFTLGALAIAGILPYDKINLQSGVFDTLTVAFNSLLHIHWPVPILSFLIAYGGISGVLAWITGPSRGLLATAHDGLLPPLMQKTNKAGVQINILILQAVIVTIVSCIFFFIKNVSVVFFLISIMAVTLYLIVYMMMYAAAIRLRYSQPELARTFTVPGGKTGMWAVAGIGFLAMLFAFVLSFVPPSQLPIGSPEMYISLVAAGTIIFTLVGFVILMCKKDSWLPPEDRQERHASDRVSPAERLGLPGESGGVKERGG